MNFFRPRKAGVRFLKPPRFSRSFCIKQWLSNPEPFRIESLNLYGHVVRYISFYIKWMVPFLKRCILQMTNIITKKGWLSDWSDQTCLLFRLQHLYSGIWVPTGCTILYQPCPNQSDATEWCWWWSAIRLQSTATYIQSRHGLRRCVRTRTRAMCGRTCACACEILSEKCVRCACVRHVFGCAMCDHTFAHFLHQNGQKKLFFVLIKNCSRISYPVLEHPFLL